MNSFEKKKIAIIGGGVSGIISLKSSLDYGKLEPVMFEKENGFSGVWNPEYGKSWKGVTTNISKYSCIFLDKPLYNIDDSIDFPSRDQVNQYLTEYVDQFKLLQYIKLNHLVEKVDLQEQSNKWVIKVRDLKSNTLSEHVFDYVIISTGVFSTPAPLDSESDKFIEIIDKDRLHHSIDYKSPDKFNDKECLIIGNSSSGCDIATDLLKNGQVKQVYHYFKRPFYVINRMVNSPFSNNKVPFEVLSYSRAKEEANKAKTDGERNFARHQYLRMFCKEQQSMENLQVTADTSTPTFATINDFYMDLVKQGRIKIIKDPTEFLLTNKEVQVILCNGFNCSLPFLSKDVLDKIQFLPRDHLQPAILYKECWPSNVPNLAFVGVYRGTYWGTLELQAMWASRVFSGILEPPTQDKIEEGLKEEVAIRRQTPRKQFPHSDVVHHSDSIAKEMGILPDFEKLKETNPELHKKLWDYTYLVFSYKLFDPQIKDENVKSQYLKYIDDFFNKFPMK